MTHGQPPEFAVDAVETREGLAVWYNVPDESLAARRAWADEMTAASDSLPQNTYVRVTLLSAGKAKGEGKPKGESGETDGSEVDQGKPIIVRITDKAVHHQGALIDVDKDAARALGMVKAGEARVRVETLRLKNASTQKPVDKKTDPVAPKASEITDQPTTDEKTEKAAAKAKTGQE